MASTSTKRRFATLDVFTAERFAGNPLAVVRDAEDLEPKLMQAIAREFGLPETVFVLRAGDPAHAAWMRIFTPAAELPFAGHPTVGCVALLGLMTSPAQPRDLTLEEEIGLVRCHVEPRGKDVAHARFDLPALPRKLEWEPDALAVAAALGISAADIDVARFRLEKWSAGVDMFMVAVKGVDILARVRTELPQWEKAFGNSGPRAVYVFCPQSASRAAAYRARMFAPLVGIPEDPATGAAAAAFAGMLAAHGGLATGKHEIVIEQGYEMGRPSTIHLEMQLEGHRLVASAIAGEAVIVTEGTLSV